MWAWEREYNWVGIGFVVVAGFALGGFVGSHRI
jgi:hypothetical protein